MLGYQIFNIIKILLSVTQLCIEEPHVYVDWGNKIQHE